jgi:predicted transcriptional regulator
MVEEKKEFSSLGFAMNDKAFSLLYMKLDGITFVERGVYGYILDFTQDQTLDNGLQDYAYPTKVRMISDGQIAKGTLNKSLRKLMDYGIVEEKKIPNKRGGKPLSAYKPLPLLSPKGFLEKYSDELSEEGRQRIRRYIGKSDGDRIHVKSPGTKKEEKVDPSLDGAIKTEKTVDNDWF